MSVFSKIKWIAGILLIFFIVLMTNLIDKENFNRLRYSVTTIYEDRIVASDILFELSMLIHEKKVAVVTSDSLFFESKNSAVNDQLQKLIQQYKETKLTEKEQLLFSALKNEFSSLKNAEANYLSAGFAENENLLASTDTIIQNIHELSKIQIREGKRQMFISNKAMNTIDLFMQVEIIFLIVMAVLVQVIILYKPKKD